MTNKRSALPDTTLAVCHDCGAKCCHDLVQPIDMPQTPDEVEELKWDLRYDTIRAFIRSHRWYRIVSGRCQYLDDNDRCTIYARRPRRCREMKPIDCEQTGRFWDTMIATPEELDAYMAERERARRENRHAHRRP